MDARLEVQSGARAGVTFPLAGDFIEIGRGDHANIRFDPERDLTVSSRHATLTRRGGRWYISDSGSLNGTRVNGNSVVGDVILSDGDRIEFGAGGPSATFRTGVQPVVATAARTRVRALVRRERRRVFVVSTIAIVTLAGVVAGFLLQNARQRAAFESERAMWMVERGQLEQRVDSVLASADATVLALQGEVAGLSDALSRSRNEMQDVRTALRTAEATGDTTDVPALRRQLQAVNAALALQQLAASLDFNAIENANRSAIVRVYVESATGAVSTGTAFAVRPDGTLATAAHVVEPSDGTAPRRIAVQFSDSDQIWRARVLARAQGADVALIKVDDILGDVPIVRGLRARADTLATGTPLAVIGFPLGGDARMPDDTAGNLARPLVTAGVIDRTINGVLEARGYGAAGASGSPMFDENGRVLAVLYGGRTDAAGQIVLGAPATHIVALLDGLR